MEKITSSKISNIDEANKKLTFKEKSAYAIGDFGNNFSWTFISNFLLYFWTDVLGIGAGIAGTIMGVSRIWDAINDPIIGKMSDNTKSKWGRYRPWIIWFTIPLAINNVICFTDFGIQNPTVRAVVAFASFFLLVLLYTCVNVPYSAMQASLTLDSKERGSVATFRLFFAYTAALIIAYGTQRFVAALGGGNSGKGFMMIAIIYSIVMIIAHVLCFKGTKEVVMAPVENVPMKESFKSLKGNWPFIILCAGFLVYGLFGYGRSAVALYYFQYKAGNALYYATYSLLYMGCSMVGIFCTPFIAKHFKNKATVVMLGYGITGVCAIAQFFVDPTVSIIPIYVLNAILGIGCGCGTTMIYGMVPDTTEYTQHKYGLRASGFISAVVNFFLKVGMAIGTSLSGIILASLGYIAGAEQSATVLNGMTALFTLIPGILALCCCFLLKFYKLDSDSYNKILDELK